ncbi:hypothetical protein TVAG_025310 [Trichomonas vaginalis G3]|uniref:Uncharacterized protein n=2 Tax=Trichomonas vaginalis (strain ATCC PRA-98 / G3) TaxID=412133 RepID=A2GAB3_TRIV3|nr:hypothetical protein TVAG_025310 [Trichomonas vaginalis G3]|eukprot:XP_001298833.1 hypothetical protein [Trichomonas vaginalis G3]
MLLLLVFALFISSNTGIGASVFAKIFLGIDGKHVELPSMFDFGLINSILDMWHSGAIVLAVLIAIMSCAWPYTKIVFMFIVWIMPASKIKLHQRQKALEVLDLLGKWSLVDSYVMILMLIAFRMKINLPPVDETDILQINLFVYPAWGFVTLVVGTILSLGCSQTILAAERYVDKQALIDHGVQALIDADEKKRKEEEELMSDYSYSVTYSYSDGLPSQNPNKRKSDKHGEGVNDSDSMEELDDKEKRNQERARKLQNDVERQQKPPEPEPEPANDDINQPLNPNGNEKKKKYRFKEDKYVVMYLYAEGFILKNLLSICVLLAIIFVLFGSYLKTFSFEFVGLAGWALRLVKAQQYREYSVIDLALQLPEAAEHKNSFGIRFTQAIYILVTNIMPLVHLLGLSILWFVPLKIEGIHILEKACEYMYSWACLDVFVISIVAAVMEISQLAKFMVGDKCVVVDVITQQYFANEDLIRDHLTCFDVITTLLKGSYLVILAAVFHTIATFGVNKYCKKINVDLSELERKRREEKGLTPLLNDKEK